MDKRTAQNCYVLVQGTRMLRYGGTFTETEQGTALSTYELI